MSRITRRQAAAGLLLLAVSATTRAGQGAGQHRPGPGQQPPRPQPQPQPQPQPKMHGQTGMRQDRLMMQDRDHIRDQDIYGGNLMSAEEREQYRDRLRSAQSDREWAQIRAEHQQEIQARARAQGIDLEPPVYGQHMMTMEERARYVTRMQEAQGETEREMIRNEHREFIRQRARELGVDDPPVEGN